MTTYNQNTPINLFTSVLGTIDYKWGQDSVLVNPDPIVTNFNTSMVSNPKGIMEITVCGEASIIGQYNIGGTYNGRLFYIPLGAPPVADPTLLPNTMHSIFCSVTDTWLVFIQSANFPPTFYTGNTIGLATPDLEISWNAIAGAALPVPTIVPVSTADLPLVFPNNSSPQSNI